MVQLQCVSQKSGDVDEPRRWPYEGPYERFSEGESAAFNPVALVCSNHALEDERDEATDEICAPRVECPGVSQRLQREKTVAQEKSSRAES